MNKLNLGCGQDYKEGWINVDIGFRDIYMDYIQLDIVWDLNIYPWPFADNSFDEINAQAILEHLESRTKSWDELRRIAKDGCKIHVSVPHYASLSGYHEPTHYHRYCYNTAPMVAKMWNFKLISNRLDFSQSWLLGWMNYIVNFKPMFYERFFATLIPTQNCFWEFEVIK